MASFQSQVMALLSLLFLLACVNGTQENTGICHQSPVLLQVGTEIHLSQESKRSNKMLHAPQIPELYPVGRSYYSNDPQASAAFFTRYLGLVSCEKNNFAPGPDLETAGVTTTSEMLVSPVDRPFSAIFVKAHFSNRMESFLETSEAESHWHDSVTVYGASFKWSPWQDFHCGLNVSLNVTRVFHDLLEISYVSSIRKPGFHIPSALRRIEHRGVSEDEFAAVPEEVQDYFKGFSHEESSCREDHRIVGTDRAWYKSTYGVKNASAAADFAIYMLGAHASEAPYDYPPGEATKGCIGGKWVFFGEGDGSTNFNLHFVEGPPPDEARPSYSSQTGVQGDLSLDDLRAYYQSVSTRMKAGCFDPALYENIIFETDTLDPFIERLEAIQAPFLTLRYASGRFALFFSFPDNEFIVVQIQGDAMTAATPLTEMEIRSGCSLSTDGESP